MYKNKNKTGTEKEIIRKNGNWIGKKVRIRIRMRIWIGIGIRKRIRIWTENG